MSSNKIATASSPVSNGIAETNDLTYTAGNSIESFRPGSSYDIKGTYTGDGYETTEDIGTLTMQKINTTLTISGNETVIRNQTMNVQCTIKENYSNTYLNRGTIILKEDNVEVARTTVTNGQNVVIQYTPTTMGTKTLQATYLDSGTEYNSSLSDEISVEVESSLVWEYPESIEQWPNETVHLGGRLLDGNTPVSNCHIIAKINNSTLRDSNGNVIYMSPNDGYFSLDVPMNSAYDGKQVQFYYVPIGESGEVETIYATTLHVKRHTISRIDVSPSSLTAKLGSKASFTFTIYNENDEITPSSGMKMQFFKGGLHTDKIYFGEKYTSPTQGDMTKIPFVNRPDQNYNGPSYDSPNGVFLITIPYSQSESVLDNLNEHINAIYSGECDDSAIMEIWNTYGEIVFNINNSQNPVYVAVYNEYTYTAEYILTDEFMGFYIYEPYSSEEMINTIRLGQESLSFSIFGYVAVFDYGETTETPISSKNITASYTNGTRATQVSFSATNFTYGKYEMVLSFSGSSTLAGEYMTSIPIILNSTG